MRELKTDVVSCDRSDIFGQKMYHASKRGVGRERENGAQRRMRRQFIEIISCTAKRHMFRMTARKSESPVLMVQYIAMHCSHL